MEGKMRILVCCHKKDVMASQPPYFPIHVGKVLSNTDLGIPGDNTGDNISEKNASYCELTGVYWAWKNFSDVDYIGLCHYRRYFDFHNLCHPQLPQKVFPVSEFPNLNLSVTDDVVSELQRGHVFVANPIVYSQSLYLRYCKRHNRDDFKAMEQIIRDGQPEKVVRAFYDTMICGNRLFPCNMFLMRWSDFDDYCSWLFPLLAQLEESIDISNYDSYQRRIFGFMGERLLNVWLRANGKHTVCKPFIMLSDDASAMKETTSATFILKNKFRSLANFFSKKMPYDKWLAEGV